MTIVQRVRCLVMIGIIIFKETYGADNVNWVTRPGVNLNNFKDLINNG